MSLAWSIGVTILPNSEVATSVAQRNGTWPSNSWRGPAPIEYRRTLMWATLRNSDLSHERDSLAKGWHAVPSGATASDTIASSTASFEAIIS